MPRLEDPILKRRVGAITVSLPGAATTEIESSVTIPIEQWLNEFPEIKQVRSNTRTNFSSIVVELEDRISDPAIVWSSIKSKLIDRAGELPDGCSEPDLTIFPLKAFAAILAIVPTSDRDEQPFQHRRLAQELRKRILNLEATESIGVFGDWGEEITVSVKPESLTSLGTSVGAIAQQISESKSVPASDVNRGSMQIMVEVQEPEHLARQIKNISILSPGNPEPIRLAEFAQVSKSPSNPKSTAAIVEGKDSIVLGVMVDNDARVDLWDDELDQVITRFESEFPDDYDVVALFKQSDLIHQRMVDLIRNLAISAVALAVIVALMMGWRCMIVVAISLPISACLVICGLRLLSIPIHQMSITGLIVALGLLIDNAVVIVEEVRARIFAGKNPLAAIVSAVQHLRMPLIGSTVTTILAFVPIATMPGPAGEFVGSLAVSVILAIAASCILAITIVPPLVIAFGVNVRRQSLIEYGIRLGPISKLYRFSLRMTFRWPIFGVLLGVALPLVGFYVAQDLKKEFFPASDRAQIQIELELPISATLESVRSLTERVIPIIDSDDRVENQHWFLGESAPTFFYNVVPRRRNNPYYAQAFIDIGAESNINDLVNGLQAKLDSSNLAARISVRKLEQGPPFDAPVEVRVFGDDLARLEQIGNRIRAIIAENESVTHTRSDLGSTVRKLSLDLNEGVMQQTRLTQKEVSKFLYLNLKGAAAGIFFDQGVQVPVHVRVDHSDRSIVESLSAMKIDSPNQATPAGPNRNPNQQFDRPSNSGHLLGSLGDFQLESDVGAITRINSQRVNEVKAYLRAGALPSEVTDEIRKTLQQSGFNLGGNFRIEFGGETEKRTQAIATLIANAVLLIMIMLLSLVAVLGSFRSAFTIALVGGLAMGLGPLALHVFGFPFGFMAIVGTMGLVGVAINDSIVVLAAIAANDKLRGANDKLRWASTIDGGSVAMPPAESSTHAAKLASQTTDEESPKDLEDVVIGCTRHILTTSLTTMIGFLPLVIYGGKFWPPLAIVISAGVCGATLLALYFVPSVDLMLRRRNSEA
jgi:multidrug efflux pump subunit AcrB